MRSKYYNFLNLIFFILLISIGKSQSIRELQDLKKQYEKVIRERNTNSPIRGADFDSDPLDERLNLNKIPVSNTKQDSIDIFNDFFGYNFFTRRDTINFWDNLPPPTNYILGPGDELIVSLWGETQIRKKYIISKDGTVYDDKVGLLNLSGKTVNSAENYLKTQFSKVYSTLKGTKATSFINISLGQLRSINVTFVGEVKYPGVYPIHPFSNVITGLIQIGGVDTTGTLRQIALKRTNNTPIIVDLYDYLINGNLPNKVQLRDNDIVVVAPRASTIEIKSGVRKPGKYELLADETLSDIIDFSGGVNHNVMQSISIMRFNYKNIEKNTLNPTSSFYVDITKSKNTILNDGDIIKINEIQRPQSEVKIIGQVKSPGAYVFYEGMMLSDLIKLSGGLSDTTFWKSIYQSRGELIRKDPKTRYEEVREVSLIDIKNGSVDIKLQNLDMFVIHANLNYFERKPVQVLGEVNVPGSYPLIRKNETLQSLISRAGGLSSHALDGGISIFRKKDLYVESSSVLKALEKNTNTGQKWIRVAWKNYDLPLIAGDSIYVQEATRSVFIEGEVYNPGLVEFQKNKNLNYYLRSAGGVTPNGNKNDVVIVYSNGTVAPKRFLGAVKIKDGSRIIVNEKETRVPFDLTGFATSTLSIISTTITILVLSQQLNNAN